MHHGDDTRPMEQRTAAIWEQFSRQLRQFIMSRVMDDAVADDLLQEVFLKIHARLDSLKDETKLESWLYQITRHAIIDHYRGQTTRVELPETLGNEAAENASRHQQIAAGLLPMIHALPPKYRDALLLTEFEGVSQKELAARLGISVSGAKSRVQRARQMLKEGLLECCHFEFDRYGTIIDYHRVSQCACTPNSCQNA